MRKIKHRKSSSNVVKFALIISFISCVSFITFWIIYNQHYKLFNYELKEARVIELANAMFLQINDDIQNGDILEAYFLGERFLKLSQGHPALDDLCKKTKLLLYQWPMFGKDHMHTHYVHIEMNGETLEPIIKERISYSILESPIYYEGIVYVGSHDSYMYAINAKNGEIIWKFKASNSIQTTAAIIGSIVIFGSEDDNIYALDKISGKLKWKYKTGGDVYSNPTIFDDKIFIGSLDKNLYAFDISGNVLWIFESNNPIESSPSIFQDYLFFRNPKSLYVVNIKNGKGIPLLSPMKGIRTQSVSISPPLIFNSQYSGPFAYNWNSKELEWLNDWERFFRFTYYPVSHSYAISENEIYYSGSSKKHSLFFIRRGGIYCIRKKDGKQIWKYKIKYLESEDYPSWGTPVVTKDNVFVALPRGEILVLDRSDGEKIISLVLPGQIFYQELCIGDSNLFITTNNGYFCSFGKSE